MNHHDLLGALDGTQPALPADGAPPTSGTRVRPGDATGVPGSEPGHRECSRKGCRNDAAWRLGWNNPRIHPPERRKSWLACAGHRTWLADYLRSRGLLKDVLPLSSAHGHPTENTTENDTENDS